jgi:hypothetical protein
VTYLLVAIGFGLLGLALGYFWGYHQQQTQESDPLHSDDRLTLWRCPQCQKTKHLPSNLNARVMLCNRCQIRLVTNGLMVTIISNLMLGTMSLQAEPAPASFWHRRSLERGVLDPNNNNLFTPDITGHYVRYGGPKGQVFYGIGKSPLWDTLLPDLTLNDQLRDMLKQDPGVFRASTDYQSSAQITQGLVAGSTIGFTSVALVLLGGLIYDRFPGNTREMRPAFYGVSLGLLTGLGLGYGYGYLETQQRQTELNTLLLKHNKAFI